MCVRIHFVFINSFKNGEVSLNKFRSRQVNTQARTKNKITLALSSVEEFRDFLNMFAEFYNNLGEYFWGIL